jgi:hypothetical protein
LKVENPNPLRSPSIVENNGKSDFKSIDNWEGVCNDNKCIFTKILGFVCEGKGGDDLFSFSKL